MENLNIYRYVQGRIVQSEDDFRINNGTEVYLLHQFMSEIIVTPTNLKYPKLISYTIARFTALYWLYSM